MTRRLIVMRHAKSSWSSPGQDDRDRPLNARGRRDAPRVAEELSRRGWRPDAVYSSDAFRTRETWDLMADVIEPVDPVVFVDSLYLGGLAEIRVSAEGWSKTHQTVLVLGHNPGWERAVEALASVPTRLTTANAALLVGAGGSWSDALSGPWILEDVVRPKELEG